MLSIARNEPGFVADLRALASQVHPVFMLPPVATAVFGAVLAEMPDPIPAALHAVAIFAAVYTAHVKDGYVDFHVRDEDDDHPMTPKGCRITLAGSTALFAGSVLGLFVLSGPFGAVLTLPTWLLGYFHAPQLDTNPVTATAGYPFGVFLAILGGYAVQTGTLSATPFAFAAVFLVLLSSVKVVDDAQDYEYDLDIEKRSVAVVLGPARARGFADLLVAAGLLLVVALAVAGPFPPTAILAAIAFGVVAAVARRGDPKVATMLLVRGSYVFLAVLIVAVHWRPLAWLW
ncbi:MAG: 1,4-dihydroxy-2-naphthoate octaprenyltransferase [Halobacteriales archaeon]|jgi:1,4-dihydroxy-2-naphthoate octaprenyltransferase